MAPLRAHAASASSSRSTGLQVTRRSARAAAPYDAINGGEEVPGIDDVILRIAEFAARLAEPGGLAEEAGATGGLVAVVDLRPDGHAPPTPSARRTARTVPGVIVGVRRGDGPAAEGWTELTDVILDGSADGDVERELDGLHASVAARPRAAAALALLLRSAPTTVEDGLVAESAVYSMLQAGPEFAAWQATRPGPRPAPEPDASQPVTLERSGDRLTVTLTRPARHNAVHNAMRTALAEALGVGVIEETLHVVLRGEGPSFCSGGDLDEFGTAPDPATAHLLRLTRSPAALAARLGARLEARVHGACIGAGVEVAAFAGRVIAAPDTFFALPELDFGLIPGSGGTVSVTRRIGRHRTAWLALTGARLGAAQARHWGLVDEIR